MFSPRALLVGSWEGCHPGLVRELKHYRVAGQLGCWDVLAQNIPIWAASIPGLGCQQPNLDVLDGSGSQNSTFSKVSGAFWVAQETLSRSPRDASEKPKTAQISPIRLLAA